MWKICVPHATVLGQVWFDLFFFQFKHNSITNTVVIRGCGVRLNLPLQDLGLLDVIPWLWWRDELKTSKTSIIPCTDPFHTGWCVCKILYICRPQRMTVSARCLQSALIDLFVFFPQFWKLFSCSSHGGFPNVSTAGVFTGNIAPLHQVFTSWRETTIASPIKTPFRHLCHSLFHQHT